MYRGDILIEETSMRKEIIKENIGFGKHFTDHMFLMDYIEGEGWGNKRIVPFGEISITPAASALHYGQSVFEGLKAYRTKDGEVQLFRPRENSRRMNRSCERMCMPTVDEEIFMKALKTLLEIDEMWVPEQENCSLYIRPFMFATEEILGVYPSKSYRFMILLSLAGSYYTKGLEPISIWVEEEYVRAAKGGTGTAKAGGNYAGGMKAQANAKSHGCTQVLWLDAKERKYIQEVGAMNIFFRVGDEVWTPKLDGSILSGITRKSVIELLKARGLEIKERLIGIDEVMDVYQKGELLEVFGTGTAAVISSVGELIYKGMKIPINSGGIGELTLELYNELTGIQYGEIEDCYNWIEKIK